MATGTPTDRPLVRPPRDEPIPTFLVNGLPPLTSRHPWYTAPSYSNRNCSAIGGTHNRRMFKIQVLTPLRPDPSSPT
jgi:hypothetical protein